VTSDDLTARRANSFGANARAYAEHRPDYPSAAIRWALAPLGPGAHHVLDLAAGTGKLTGGLVAEGHHVTAVEPDESMLSELVRRHGGVRALPGAAERVPLPDSAVDAVVVGQAFHWFDPVRAMAEIARVLRPGGVLAGLWNHVDSRVGWVAEFDEVCRSSVRPMGDPGAADDTMPAHELFEDAEVREFPHRQRRTAETLVETIGTHSHTLVIPRQEWARLRRRILDFLRSRPETAEGGFDLPIVTRAKRATRRA